MQNAEKVEIGYTLPKERWQEAAKNLEELGNVLACMALHHVAEFATDKCRIIPLPGKNGG